jgi:hypothetical protein
MPLPEMNDVEARARYEREELLAISRALSSERDIHKLLDLILLKSRQITGADAGSVYVVESTDAGGGLQSTRERGRRRRANAVDGRQQAGKGRGRALAFTSCFRRTIPSR